MNSTLCEMSTHQGCTFPRFLFSPPLGFDGRRERDSLRDTCQDSKHQKIRFETETLILILTLIVIFPTLILALVLILIQIMSVQLSSMQINP